MDLLRLRTARVSSNAWPFHRMTSRRGHLQFRGNCDGLSPIPYTHRKGRQSMRVLLLIAAIAVPIIAAAEPAKIGVLTFEETPEALKQALRSGLREQGYTEGKNITLEWREAGGKVERANQPPAELVGMRVDVIVASLTPAVSAAKKATSTIPIVMAPAAD